MQQGGEGENGLDSALRLRQVEKIKWGGVRKNESTAERVGPGWRGCTGRWPVDLEGE